MFAMHYAVSFTLLTALSLTYSCALRRVERLRRVASNDWLPDMNGCWTFASVMLLPPPWIAAALAVFYAAEWPSRRAVGAGRPGKYAYSCAASITAAVASSWVLHSVGGYVGIPTALAAFTTINIGLISLAIIASRQFFKLGMLKNVNAHSVELATHLIGAAMGGAMAWHQTLAVFVLPVLVTTHLASTRRAVTDSGSFDESTGLWDERLWTFRASELIAVGEIVTVLVIDSHTADQAVLADVVRPCLDGDALFGCYGDGQLVSISTTGALAVGEETAQRATRTLCRSGSGFAVGSRTSRCEDVTEMLGHALADLMGARERVGITRRPR